MFEYGHTPSPVRFVTSLGWFRREFKRSRVSTLSIAFFSFVTATLAIALSGCGAGPGPISEALQISPRTIDFGNVSVGQTAKSNVSIVNVGPVSVAISQLNLSGQSFSIVSNEKFPINIPANGSHTVSIGFAPASTTDYSGQITMMDASSNSVGQIAMQGQGANGGLLSVSTASLDFGSVAVNSAQMQTLTLTSTGTSSVTVNSAAIAGTGFTLTGGTFPMILNPSQTATLQVQFSPAASGTANGQLTISSSSASGSSTVVPLSGTGMAATPLTNPSLAVSTTSLNFGSVTVNSPTMMPVTLISNGTAPVTVNSAAIAGTGFTVVGGTLPMTLNPSQTVTLQVQFDPTTTGTASGQLTIGSNSTNGSTAVVSLSGTGTAAPSPILSVSTAGLSFGSVTVNTATTQSLTLTSTGTSPVTVNSAVISGAGFTILGGSLPATLNPTQSLTLQVQFDPTTTGTASGQLTINSNSSTGSTSVVTLSGTSTAALSPQLTISAATLSFGSVTVNTATTQSLTLTSTGTSPVTVNSAVISGAGFTIVGGSLPATLNPTQSLTLQVQFDPTTTGTASGQLTINSNSSTGSTSVVTLSGTSTAAPSPQLTISAATSELWQRDGEHGDDAIVDADIDGDIACDGELCGDQWGRLYDCGRELAGDAEPDAVADAAGAV